MAEPVFTRELTKEKARFRFQKGRVAFKAVVYIVLIFCSDVPCCVFWRPEALFSSKEAQMIEVELLFELEGRV